MAFTFTNDKQLRDFLSAKCARAVDNTKEKIRREFDFNLSQFYGEFSPEEYIRTGALFNSLRVTGVRRASGGDVDSAIAEVWFDTPHWQHGLVPLQSGGYGFSDKSDEEIFDVIMKSGKPHGGYASGTAIWKVGMRNLGGKRGINNLLRQELKKQGL